MKRYISIMKSKMVKALMIGSCLTMISTSVAFAETSGVDPETSVSQETQSGDVLLQKQKEIDKYVFEQHKEELAEKGITVTHTAPVNDYVEIGITPYNDTNADYLYEIFGKDMVKVVEGQQAVTMDLATASTDEPANDAVLQKQQEIDKYVFEQHKEDLAEKGIKVTHTAPLNDVVEIGITPYNDTNADYLYEIFGSDMVKVVEGQQAVTMELAAAATDAGEVRESVEKSDTSASNPIAWYIAFAAAVLLGITAFVTRKKLVARK